MNASSAGRRKPVNISMDEALVEEAKNLGLNLSHFAERGISQAVAEERARRWKVENADAIAAYNQHVREHGLPLAKYRMF